MARLVATCEPKPTPRPASTWPEAAWRREDSACSRRKVGRWPAGPRGGRRAVGAVGVSRHVRSVPEPSNSLAGGPNCATVLCMPFQAPRRPAAPTPHPSTRAATPVPVPAITQPSAMATTASAPSSGPRSSRPTAPAPPPDTAAEAAAAAAAAAAAPPEPGATAAEAAGCTSGSRRLAASRRTATERSVAYAAWLALPARRPGAVAMQQQARARHEPSQPPHDERHAALRRARASLPACAVPPGLPHPPVYTSYHHITIHIISSRTTPVPPPPPTQPGSRPCKPAPRSPATRLACELEPQREAQPLQRRHVRQRQRVRLAGRRGGTQARGPGLGGAAGGLGAGAQAAPHQRLQRALERGEGRWGLLGMWVADARATWALWPGGSGLGRRSSEAGPAAHGRRAGRCGVVRCAGVAARAGGPPPAFASPSLRPRLPLAQAIPRTTATECPLPPPSHPHPHALQPWLLLGRDRPFPPR